MTARRQTHPFAPVCDARSRVLILGSFPSVKSRENAFYYGNPQNRFWRVLAAVYGEETPETIARKEAFLLGHALALWDVAGACMVNGSADGSIRAAEPNDLRFVLAQSPIERVLLNGKTAERLFLRFWRELPLPCRTLPSTSPANAAWTLPRLIDAWRAALLES